MRHDSKRSFHWWPIPFAGVPLFAFFGVPLWFSPGWANGWPFGITIYTVWSAAMAAIASAMFLSFCVGLGAAIAYVLVDQIGLRITRAVFVVWLVVVAALAVELGFMVYRESYASTLEMWPNGYGS